MKTYVIAFLLSMMACAALVPLVRALAFRIGAVSVPGGRHVHDRQVPRLGGVAMCIAFFVPLAGVLVVENDVTLVASEQASHMIGLAVGGIVMCTLGVLDDTKNVRALYKLAVQVGVAMIAYGLGYRIDVIRTPFFGDLSMGIFSMPITIMWIVGIVNAINLIDGLDGLAAGVVFFAGVTNLVVALLAGSMLVALLMSALLGAVLGFLLFNFNPARIFMGDSGSYFLGYLLATISLLGSMQRASTAVSLVVPILALGVPIFDTLFSMVRRVLERRSIFSPDRGHLHHRLLDMGLTHRRAVLILYGVSLVFTIAAVAVAMGRSWQVGLALFVACVVLVGIVRFAGYFEYFRTLNLQRARIRSADVERIRAAMLDYIGEVRDASDESEVFIALDRFVKASAIVQVGLEPIAASPTERVVVSTPPDAPEDSQRRRGHLVSACFPIGRDVAARAKLHFEWESDEGTVSPQAEVLLQFVVDVLARELERVGSEAAPRASRVPPRTADTLIDRIEAPLGTPPTAQPGARA
jgi:UDP-GlcNAc:undecaprenyl-phosphate GlcNAc-1-phosphate transferase